MQNQRLIIQFFIFFLFLFSFVTHSASNDTPIYEVPYSFGGNFVGWMIVPDFPGKLPVVIYSYHEDLHRAKRFERREMEFNLQNIMHEFARWGVICFVPMDRGQSLNSIKGAVYYLKKHPRVDTSGIHLVGTSQGAFLSLLASADLPDVDSVSIINPSAIHDTGNLSLPGLVRVVDDIHVPVLQVVGDEFPIRDYRFFTVIRDILVQQGVELLYISYPASERWFLNPAHDYMQDIYEFILKKTFISPDNIDTTPSAPPAVRPLYQQRRT